MNDIGSPWLGYAVMLITRVECIVTSSLLFKYLIVLNQSLTESITLTGYRVTRTTGYNRPLGHPLITLLLLTSVSCRPCWHDASGHASKDDIIRMSKVIKGWPKNYELTVNDIQKH